MDKKEENQIKTIYLNILEEFVMKAKTLQIDEDKYSGVFLPLPFSSYYGSKPRVMFVGRETAGWNTDNDKNTWQRVITEVDKGNAVDIVDEAIERYEKHMSRGQAGKISSTDASHFKRYYKKVAMSLNQELGAPLYTNVLAWDYDKKSPLNRPKQEEEVLKEISLKLLAAQIEAFKPQIIIFATGQMHKIDPLIKQLFEKYFRGHKTVEETFVSKKFWEFEAANARCFRIAHPRANSKLHAEIRKSLLRLLREEYS